MMEKIRTAANHIVVKVIFGLIILSFIFAGVGGIFSGSSNDNMQYVAKVNGDGIRRITFENAVQLAIHQNKLNVNQAQEMDALRQAVLRQQVEGELLRQFAQRLSISPTTEQIKDHIRQEPYFQENGQFNNKQYLAILAANRITPDDYAESVREMLSQKLLGETILYSDFILPVERQEMAPLLGQTRTVQLATLTPADFGIAKRTFDEKAMRTYYEEHPQQFTAPIDQIKLQFVRLPRQVLEHNVSVSDAEIKAYYEAHKHTYLEPEKVAYSLIETKDEVTATSLHQQLAEGADFASLATKHSLYPLQRQNAGQLGWFDPADLPDLLKQAQLQAVGSFSMPLRQDDGHYLLIRLDNKREAGAPPLAQIEKRVKGDLLQDKTDKQLQKTESMVQGLLNQSMPLAEIAKKLNVSVEKTRWLTQHDKPLSYSPLLEQVMPRIGGKGNSDLIGPVYIDETQDLYVAEIVGVREAGLVPFSEVKPEVQRIMQTQDMQQRFVKASEHYVAELRAQKPTAIAKVPFSKIKTLSRADRKMNPNIIEMVYNLVPSVTSKPVFGLTYLPNGKAIIASLLSVNNQKPKQKMDGPLFYEHIMHGQKSLMNALFSKAEIKVLDAPS